MRVFQIHGAKVFRVSLDIDDLLTCRETFRLVYHGITTFRIFRRMSRKVERIRKQCGTKCFKAPTHGFTNTLKRPLVPLVWHTLFQRGFVSLANRCGTCSASRTSFHGWKTRHFRSAYAMTCARDELMLSASKQKLRPFFTTILPNRYSRISIIVSNCFYIIVCCSFSKSTFVRNTWFNQIIMRVYRIH